MIDSIPALAMMLALSYLLGSVPSAVWAGRVTRGIDIREHGSGNAGATNTFRILGWKSGVVVSLLDLGKGYVAAAYIGGLALKWSDLPTYTGSWETASLLGVSAGVAAVVGHMYPVWAGFRGGKGALTTAGMLYGLEPVSISLAMVVFFGVLATSRYVSLASMSAAVSYPVFLLMLRQYFGFEDIDGSLLVVSSVLMGFIILKHRENIRRLREGTERRADFSSR